MRADTQAEISHAAQQEAVACGERMQADDAADAALKAAEEANARAPAAAEREQAADARASEAEVRDEETQRGAQTRSPAPKLRPPRRPPPRPPRTKQPDSPGRGRGPRRSRRVGGA